MADEHEPSESGNWNVNRDYIAQLAKLLAEADYYAEIAKFGFEDIIQDICTKESDKVILRIRGLEKYIFKLKTIIKNCLFAMTTQEHKKNFYVFFDNLEFIENYCMKNLINKVQEFNKLRIEINKDIFDSTFKKVQEMDMDMRSHMKDADLLFMNKEYIDPKKQKKKWKDDLISGG